MLRTTRSGSSLAGSLLLAATLGACSGGRDLEDDRRSDTLDTPQAVVKRLAAGPLSAFFAPGFAAKSGVPRASFDREPRARSTAKAVFACPDGGTREEFADDTGDLGSPFTLETFLIEDTFYDACEETFDDGSVLRQTGLESFGCPLSDSSEFPCSDGSNVEIYSHWLGSASSPFEDATSGITAAGNDVQYLINRPGYRFHSETVHDFGGVVGRTRIETHSYSPSTGTVSVNGSAPKSFRGSYGLSSTDPLIRVRLRNPGAGVRLTVDGPSSLSGTGCELGTFRVTTVQPIQYTEDEFGGIADVFAGRVEVRQDGAVAVAEIAADGALRVTDARGRTTVYGSVEDVRADLGGCLDFAAQ